MKKLAFGMAAAIAAVCIGASSVFAASQSVPFGAAPDSAAGSGYVDSNGNGVCDHCLNSRCTAGTTGGCAQNRHGNRGAGGCHGGRHQ